MITHEGYGVYVNLEDIFLGKLYDVYQLYASGDFSKVKSSPYLTALFIGSHGENYYSGTLQQIIDSAPNLSSIILFLPTGISGNISVLSSLNNLTRLVIFDERTSSNIVGTLSSVGSLINLTSLALCQTAVTGSIEDFVEAQVAAGRTSGTCNFDIRIQSFTLNNEYITIPGQYALKITYTASTVTLSANGSTLATYNTSNQTWTYQQQT